MFSLRAQGEKLREDKKDSINYRHDYNYFYP